MSIKAAVKKAGNHMSEHARSVSLEPVLNKEGEHGGFMLEHNMHDYEHPMHGSKIHLKNHNEVAKHLKECKACSGGMSGNKKEADSGDVED